MTYIDILNGDIIFIFISIVIILIFHVVFLLIIHLKIKDRKIKKLFVVMVFIQQIILILDNFVIGIPLLTADARNFEQAAWNKVLGIESGLTYELYTKIILYPLYKITNYRLPALLGEINILFNLITNIIIYKVFLLKKVRLIKIYKIMIIIMFLPATILLRSGPLREGIIILFFTLSIYYCFKLEKKFNMKNLSLMLIYIVISAIFHSGMIFFLGGYIYILYKERKRMKIQYLILVVLVIFLFMLFSGIILNKIGELSLENLIFRLNRGTEIFEDNGSTYLRGVYFNTIKDVIIFLPLKVFYFLFSPTLGMIRGIYDIIVILVDSIFYYYFIFKITVNIFKMKIFKYLTNQEKKYYIGLLIGLVLVIIIFSLGTGTAGTALRHRNKIFFVLVILYEIIKKKEEEKIGNSIYNK